MKSKQLKQLLEKYRTGVCTPEEKALLESWYISLAKNVQDQQPSEKLSEIKQIAWDEIKEYTGIEDNPSKKGVAKLWLSMAAAVLVFISVGIWFYNNRNVDQSDYVAGTVKQDITPGGNKAVLTLSNGTKITLDDAQTGELARQAGVRITKTADGQLVYTSVGKARSASGNPVFNTITTPRGGQYQINLPDGTRVWLNAGSSLRYPAFFSGSERRVELTGEGYFEVAPDKNMPFKVASEKQVVEVLGTHFNINSYADEMVTRTTLVEGSVKISHPASRVSKLLRPGQQAKVKESINVVNVDTDGVVGWKNGFIVFENEKIESVMRKLARWYDVDIVYEGEMGDYDYNGSVSRFENVSKILELLELTRSVHFKIVPGDASGKGRRIIVMP